jgi:S-DNA-T family DNA segregation ATPase FtsK/SpoIIIE
MDLLADVESTALIVDEEAIRKKSILLENTLREFGVEGRVAEVKTGPVITIYEFVPAAGVKVSKIASLSDDLARALSAISIRIVAPIPGTSVVGIEVPNAKRQGVRAKELLDSRKFKEAKDKLTLCLGKDILGRAVMTDLAKIPHLLIAGSTGSGKSVAMNLMICSILARCHPREVRFLMIDPKMLEFSIYEGIPHLLVPVVTDPKKAASALRGIVAEMERRYRLMSKQGVRNIDGYNKLVADWLGPREAKRRLSQHLSEDEGADEEGNPDFLPYIVVVIDELADLMMVSSREVEETMTRLAQMARAAGIHLLVATQRPSVDVVTGLIKANFPSRIALRVATRTDSRTILDMNGAERLLGKGDMLFVPPGTNAPVRIHGAYVSEKEIRNFVNHWRGQGPAVFHEELFVQEDTKDGFAAEDEDDFDERYDDAVALVARTGEASISLIQRHLRIGYNRAARLIERMEREGVVGPSEGAKRRQVLIRDIPGAEVESIDAS